MSSSPEKTPPSAQERSLAERGANEWNDYQQRFVPIESSFARQLQAMPEKSADMAGAATASMWQEMGTLPGGTKLGGLVKAYNGQSEGLAMAASAAARGGEDAKIRGLLKMASYGRGLADQSTQSLSSLADSATRAAIANTSAKNARTDAVTTGLGTAVGAGTNAYINRTPSSTAPANSAAGARGAETMPSSGWGLSNPSPFLPTSSWWGN